MIENVLICTLGESSPVVTEVLDKLMDRLQGEKPQTQIHRVVVLYTNHPDVLDGPEDKLETRIKKEEVRLKGYRDLYKFFNGLKNGYQYIKDGKIICCEPVKLEPKLLSLSDIYDYKSNQTFADSIFETILDEKQKGNRVFLSIAGGRKTMSAYAFLGGILFDVEGLYHVLVNDKTMEILKRKNDPFQCDVSQGDYLLIEIPPLRLQTLISSYPVSKYQLWQKKDERELYETVMALAADDRNQELIKSSLNLVVQKVESIYHETLRKNLEKDTFHKPWEILVITIDCEGMNKYCNRYFADMGEFINWDYKDLKNALDYLEDNKKFKKNFDTDFILLDIDQLCKETSGMDPLYVTRKIRSLNRHIPIILIAEQYYLEDLIPSLNHGAYWFLRKPLVYELPKLMESLYEQKSKTPAIKVLWGAVKVDNQPELEELLRRLFPDAENEKIEVIGQAGKGLSGTTNLWIKAGRVALNFVKVGHRLDMLEEKENYEEFVPGFVHNCSGRIEKDAVIAEDLAAIAYTSVGSPVVSSKSGSLGLAVLGDIIKGSPFEKIKKIFDTLFNKVLSNWYNETVESAILNPYQEYGIILPPLYEVAFEDFESPSSSPEAHILPMTQLQNQTEVSGLVKVTEGQLFELQARGQSGKIQLYHPESGFKVNVVNITPDKLSSKKLHKKKTVNIVGNITETLEGLLSQELKQLINSINPEDDILKIVEEDNEISLINPIPYIFRVFEKIYNLNISVHKSVIHGDLNLANILVEDQNVWLVDFAKTRRGHTLIDFVKLETEIKTHVLSRFIKNNSLFTTIHWIREFEKTLPSEKNDTKSIIPELKNDKHPDVKNVFDTIKEIRNKAFSYCRLDNLVDYFLPLMVYSLSTLKFKNLDEIFSDGDKLPKRIAFISSSVALEHICKHISFS